MVKERLEKALVVKSLKLNVSQENIGGIRNKLLEGGLIDKEGSITADGKKAGIGNEGDKISFSNPEEAQKTLLAAGFIKGDGSVSEKGENLGLSDFSTVGSRSGGGVVRVSTISQSEIDFAAAKLAEKGIVVKGTGENNSITFNDLAKFGENGEGAKAATGLINNSLRNNSRDVQRNESSSFLNAIATKTDEKYDRKCSWFW